MSLPLPPLQPPSQPYYGSALAQQLLLLRPPILRRSLEPSGRRVMVNNRHCTLGIDSKAHFHDDWRGKAISKFDIPECEHVPACFTADEHELMCDLNDADCIIRQPQMAAQMARSSRAFDLLAPLTCNTPAADLLPQPLRRRRRSVVPLSHRRRLSSLGLRYPYLSPLSYPSSALTRGRPSLRAQDEVFLRRNQYL